MKVPVFDMLRFLSVRHLAVIDRLDVEFGPGLNVLTGETGAGKSMLVEAIDLLVGGRASADLRPHRRRPRLRPSDLRNGEWPRSDRAPRDLRAGPQPRFIDDTLATAAALREFGESVVSLHGQHEHRSLVDPAEHIALFGRLWRRSGSVGRRRRIVRRVADRRRRAPAQPDE